MARYVPNSSELEALLRSSAVSNLVMEHGDSIARRAGDGFVASYRQGKSRFGGIVYADTWSAKHRDMHENILVRVIG